MLSISGKVNTEELYDGVANIEVYDCIGKEDDENLFPVPRFDMGCPGPQITLKDGRTFALKTDLNIDRSVTDIPVHGIIIGDTFMLSVDAYRCFEGGENGEAYRCHVGNRTAVFPSPQNAEAEGTSWRKGRMLRPDNSAWTTGATKTLIFAVVKWSGYPVPGDNGKTEAEKEKEAIEHWEMWVPKILKHMKDMSFGKFKVTYTIPQTVYEITTGYGTTDAPNCNAGELKKVMKDHPTEPYDPDDFTFFSIGCPNGNWPWSGVASMPGSTSRYNGLLGKVKDPGQNWPGVVLAHEWGHNLGLHHAGFADSTYANDYDAMGNRCRWQSGHFSTGYKHSMAWLTKDDIGFLALKENSTDCPLCVTKGHFALSAYDRALGTGEKKSSIRVSIGSHNRVDAVADQYLWKKASSKDNSNRRRLGKNDDKMDDSRGEYIYLDVRSKNNWVAGQVTVTYMPWNGASAGSSKMQDIILSTGTQRDAAISVNDSYIFRGQRHISNPYPSTNGVYQGPNILVKVLSSTFPPDFDAQGTWDLFDAPHSLGVHTEIVDNHGDPAEGRGCSAQGCVDSASKALIEAPLLLSRTQVAGPNAQQCAEGIANSKSVQIKNKAESLCLEVEEGDGLKDGSRVFMSNCMPNWVTQQWTYDDNSGEVKYKSFCLDAEQPDGNGKLVRLWICDPSRSANQQWNYDGNLLSLKVAGGKCIDAPSRGIQGSKLTTYTCNAGNNNQKWDLRSVGDHQWQCSVRGTIAPSSPMVYKLDATHIESVRISSCTLGTSRDLEVGLSVYEGKFPPIEPVAFGASRGIGAISVSTSSSQCHAHGDKSTNHESIELGLDPAKAPYWLVVSPAATRTGPFQYKPQVKTLTNMKSGYCVKPKNYNGKNAVSDGTSLVLSSACSDEWLSISALKGGVLKFDKVGMGCLKASADGGKLIVSADCSDSFKFTNNILEHVPTGKCAFPKSLPGAINTNQDILLKERGECLNLTSTPASPSGALFEIIDPAAEKNMRGTFELDITWGQPTCYKGYFKNNQTGICEICPADTYKDVVGPSACQVCPHKDDRSPIGSPDVSFCVKPNTGGGGDVSDGDTHPDGYLYCDALQVDNSVYASGGRWIKSTAMYNGKPTYRMGGGKIFYWTKSQWRSAPGFGGWYTNLNAPSGYIQEHANVHCECKENGLTSYGGGNNPCKCPAGQVAESGTCKWPVAAGDCPTNQYKNGQGACTACPATFTSQPGASKCSCSSGYSYELAIGRDLVIPTLPNPLCVKVMNDTCRQIQSSRPIALFERSKGSEEKKWRCFGADALTLDGHYYDVAKGSSNMADRNSQLQTALSQCLWEKVGKEGKGVCTDIDECSAGTTNANSFCSMKAAGCKNLPGSWECGCPAGFENYYSEDYFGKGQCVACTGNTYSNGPQMQCMRCPNGTRMEAGANHTSVSQCKCNPLHTPVAGSNECKAPLSLKVESKLQPDLFGCYASMKNLANGHIQFKRVTSAGETNYKTGDISLMYSSRRGGEWALLPHSSDEGARYAYAVDSGAHSFPNSAELNWKVFNSGTLKFENEAINIRLFKEGDADYLCPNPGSKNRTANATIPGGESPLSPAEVAVVTTFSILGFVALVVGVAFVVHYRKKKSGAGLPVSLASNPMSATGGTQQSAIPNTELTELTVSRNISPASALSAQWQELIDEESGEKYYWDAASNRTSWTAPPGMGDRV
jgi:hypothetical protein